VDIIPPVVDKCKRENEKQQKNLPAGFQEGEKRVK
jgi:hypothetical protein